MAASQKTSEAQQLYLIALGSNRRHHAHGAPEKVLLAALAALHRKKLSVIAISRIVTSLPLGPSLRRYANAAAVIRFAGSPPELLVRLKHVEQAFGRRHCGRRWAERVLDLDIVLWEGGTWSLRALTVPHIAFRERRFVLGPARTIAPRWRDPLTSLTLSQLHARLTQPRPLPRDPAW